MSDFLHESNELFDENGYPNIKEYTEGQIRDAFNSGYAVGQEQGAEIEVLKALEDVRAEITENIETIIGKYDSNTKPENMPSRKIERNNGRTEAIDIINRKIAEVKGDKPFRYAKEIIETQSPPSEGVNGEEFEKWLREGDKA